MSEQRLIDANALKEEVKKLNEMLPSLTDEKDKQSVIFGINILQDIIDNAPTVGKHIHIDDVYRLIAGHSDYHGDNILSAFTCLAEGKEVHPIKPINIDNAPTVDTVSVMEEHEKIGFEKGFNEGYAQAVTDRENERPKGVWVHTDNRWGLGEWECNKCHGYSKARDNFCGNCGAEMRGGGDKCG